MCKCDCLCKRIIAATEVTVSGGITTVTIPADTNFADRKQYCLGLFGVEIPAGTAGTQINITDGTNTFTLFNKLANYWRPCRPLQNGETIKICYFNDPSHLLKG